MGWEAWLVAAIVVVLILALAKEIAGADVLCISLLTVLLVAGEVSGSKLLPRVRDAVSDFGNPGLITVGVLFVVVTGLLQTGAMSLVTGPLIGRPKTAFSAQLRILLPVTTMSAFLNNTPIVAMFMPVCDDLCKKANISPSKLFMPMAYAATLGGVCTMIGTSTNLVVNAALVKSNYPAFQMWDIAWVGIPCAVSGVLYFLIFGRWLLPALIRADAVHGLGLTATVLSRDPARFLADAPEVAASPAVRFHPGDVRDFAFPDGDFTHAIHGAATSAAGPPSSRSTSSENPAPPSSSRPTPTSPPAEHPTTRGQCA